MYIPGPDCVMSEDVIAKTLTYITEGKSLKSIAAIEGMPSVELWYKSLKSWPGLLERYRQSKEDQADALAEELIDLADMATPVDVNVRRLQIDTRKWTAAKLKPKKYGDSLDLSSGGEKLNFSLISYNQTNNVTHNNELVENEQKQLKDN